MTTIVLSDDQQAVVDAFPGFLLGDDSTMTITGAAGTGKSFLVQQLTVLGPAQQKMCQLLDPTIKPRKFIYSATTNKAAEVLRQILGVEVHTIHKVLGLRVHNNYQTGKEDLVSSGRRHDLRNSVLFIDEASMINDHLAAEIRKAIKRDKDCKVVFVGDKYQLPPVKEDICSIFRDGMPNVHHLTEIHRQAAGSPIIQLGHEYRKLLDNPVATFPRPSYDNKSVFGYTDKAEYFQKIREAVGAKRGPDDVRVLAWSNNRVHTYNNWIRKSILKQEEMFEEGDLMVTNKPILLPNERGGEIVLAPTDFQVRIAEVEPASRSMSGVEVPGFHIRFWNESHTEASSAVFQPQDWKYANRLMKAFAKDKNWESYFNIKNHWVDLRPIYASTVHKAQGSTYRTVFIDVEDIGRNTRWRDLVRMLYVAITRASHEVHLYGTVTTNHQIREANDTLEAFSNVQQLLQY